MENRVFSSRRCSFTPTPLSTPAASSDKIPCSASIQPTPIFSYITAATGAMITCMVG